LRKVVVDRPRWDLVVDAAQSRGKYKRFWGNIGLESFKSGVLTSASRQLFDYIKAADERVGDGTIDHNAFRYFRAHNLFSNGVPPWGEGLDIYQVDPDGKTHYNWKLVDEVFDRLLRYKFKPIIEFGFTPDALASIPDRRQQWGKANISPPKDYAKWERLVFETVLHLVQRYGKEEVKSWYFEVWNEPDLGWLFWIESPDKRRKPYGDIQAYHSLYDHTVTAAKAAFPAIRIGGPASAGGDIDKLLEHIYVDDNHSSNGTSRIDFISSHAYNTVGFDYRQKMKNSLLSKIYWKLRSCTEHDHPNVRKHVQSLPFLLTETGPKFKQKHDLVNRGRYSAAWYAKMVDGMFYLSDRLGKPFQPEEVVLWASNQVVRNFDIRNGGIATTVKTETGKHVVKLPIFNVIEALSTLSDERISLESGSQFGDAVHAIATKSGVESLQVLVYHIDEHANERNAASPESVAVSLSIKNLPFPRFELRQFVIDENHSNTYALWLKAGKPRRFSAQQYQELLRNQDLAQVGPPVKVSSEHTDRYQMAFTLQTQSVRLITLNRLK